MADEATIVNAETKVLQAEAELAQVTFAAQTDLGSLFPDAKNVVERIGKMWKGNKALAEQVPFNSQVAERAYHQALLDVSKDLTLQNKKGKDLSGLNSALISVEIVGQAMKYIQSVKIKTPDSGESSLLHVNKDNNLIDQNKETTVPDRLLE